MLVANWPVTTRQGVNFEVSSHRLPLYLKAFEFLSRSAQYQQVAAEITRASSTDEQRAVAVFDWTSRRIMRTPDGWPIVDDHILNIIIRGYGTNDQRADVFATLLTYAGVPAFWQKMRAPEAHEGIILTFVLVDGRWRVVDVANELLFRNVRGELATLEELTSTPALVAAAGGAITIGTTPYPDVIAGLRMPAVPQTLRAELQMPGRRVLYEAKRALGWGRTDGTER